MLREERLCSECIHGTISYIIATVTKITTEGLGETKYVIDITHKQHAPEDSFSYQAPGSSTYFYFKIWYKIFFFLGLVHNFGGSGTKTEFYN